jgi:endonuclease/exonuclease/phosphatase family metal-dependent hydrolase
LAGAGVPAIVTGDLNVTDDHPGYEALVTADGPQQLHDVFRQVYPTAGPEEATCHNFSGGRKGRRIDFILTTPELKGIEAAIDHTNDEGRYPSDHYPVTAVLKVEPPAGK